MKRKRQQWVVVCTDEAGQEHYGSIGDRHALQSHIEIAQGFLPGRQFRLEPLPIASLPEQGEIRAIVREE